MSHHPSGRPEPGEYAAYASEDIAQVAGGDIAATLAELGLATMATLGPLEEGFATTFRYAPGKWSLKQMLGHLMDDERIFLYRMLCMARGEEAPLPGFDENAYMRFAGFEERSLADLISEFRITRAATVAFLQGLPALAWGRRGMVNGYEATVRGLAFHLAGHEMHHLRMVRDRYFADDATF